MTVGFLTLGCVQAGMLFVSRPHSRGAAAVAGPMVTDADNVNVCRFQNTPPDACLQTLRSMNIAVAVFSWIELLFGVITFGRRYLTRDFGNWVRVVRVFALVVAQLAFGNAIFIIFNVTNPSR